MPTVLKRLLMTALGALGLGVFASPTIAQNHLPAPEGLVNISECIRSYKGNLGNPDNIRKLDDVDSTTAERAAADRYGLDERYNPDLNSVVLTVAGAEPDGIVCMRTTIGSGNNAVTVQSIRDALEAARSRAGSLPGLGDDDFADNLAELKQQYGGPLANKVYDEYKAALELRRAENALAAKFDPADPTPDDNDPNGSGDNPNAFSGLVTNYGNIDIDETDNDNAVSVSDLLAVATLPTVDRNSMGVVTGLTANGDAPTEGAVPANETFDNVSELLTRLDGNDADTSGTIEAAERGIRQIKKDYADLLDSEWGEQNLSAVQKTYYQTVIKRADSAIRGMESLLTKAERGNALPAGTAEADRQAARNTANLYRTRLNDLQNLTATVNSKITDFDTARKAVRSAITDPKMHMQQLLDLATQQHRDAVGNQEGSSRIADLKAIQTAADKIKMDYDRAVGDGTTPSAKLLEKIVAQDDTGQALINAVTGVQKLTTDNTTEIGTLKDKVEMLTGDDEEGGGIEELTTRLDMLYTVDDPETDVDESGGQVTTNKRNIEANTDDLDDVWTELYGTERGVDAQHDDLGACAADALGLSSLANCNKASIAHNATDISGLAGTGRTDETVMGNAGAIKDLGVRIDDEVADLEEADRALGVRIDEEAKARMDADTALGVRIDDEAKARMDEDMALGVRIDEEAKARMDEDMALGVRIDDEAKARIKGDADEAAARMAEDTALGGRIDAEAATRGEMDMTLATAIAEEATTRGEMDMTLATAITEEATTRGETDMMLATAIDEEVMTRASADMGLSGRIDSNAGSISSNADAIAANMGSIGSNASAISDNRNMIGELSDDLDVVRAGVAASMALAGMPAINGRGISIGVGSFDGESAFAVGFQIQGEQASFKVGITSGGGATGASAGVGFNF